MYTQPLYSFSYERIKKYYEFKLSCILYSFSLIIISIIKISFFLCARVHETFFAAKRQKKGYDKSFSNNAYSYTTVTQSVHEQQFALSTCSRRNPLSLLTPTFPL